MLDPFELQLITPGPVRVQYDVALVGPLVGHPARMTCPSWPTFWGPGSARPSASCLWASPSG
eukprot:117347-Pyramimonas_sp.AAC.1